jgi:hypothetical protein
MPATPLVNGTNYSWANVTLTLFGVPVTGVTAIEYNTKQKKENNYGAGVDPVSRGYGNKEHDGHIELYLDTWKKIVAAAPDRDPLLIDKFDIQVVFGGSRVTADKDVLRACEFTENPFTGKSGDTKLTVKIPLIIGSIER